MRSNRTWMPLPLLGCLMLAGCLGTARKPLEIVAPAPAVAPAVPAPAAIDRQLVVALPSSTAMLDGSRVVARPRPGELAYLSGVALPDSAPHMLQDAVVEALSASGLRAVARQGQGLRGDWSLNLQLLRFEVDYSAGEAAGRVEIEALLVDARNGRAIARQRFTEATAAPRGDSRAGAEALLSAAQDAVSAIVGWIVAQPAGNPTTDP